MLRVRYQLFDLLQQHGGLIVGHAVVDATAEATATLESAEGPTDVVVR